ncbi:MAG: C-GCAxxG-C-C family (seleno)protein [Paraclostridium sp.]|uniref:C-GCAxxG-C-C family (seleno)protein n=1 Tax=Paraclostridium sp. TaxID=2023273 RepID=UPI003042B11F
MTRPSQYHKEGYNCAEAIIKSYNEDHNTDIPVALGSGMGTGATVGSLCGAVNAAILVLGYLKGREDNSQSNDARTYSRELMSRVREKYDSEICKDLKRNKISCSEIIDFSYDALNDIIEK